MEQDQKSGLGFAPSRLPWIVGTVALVLYLLTLNHWVRLESLAVVARVGGWDPAPELQAPLLYLLTLPIRFFPPSAQAVALNALSALFGALALTLLARTVALLPYDRTRETRVRQQHRMFLLGIPLAWLPAAFAVVLCGLQLTFWQHATVGTGEMLDLLLFAFVVRCLVEYRVSRNERRLTQLAFVYGIAIANNYAMIPLLPLFVVALIWIKGFDVLQGRFLARMIVAGLLGLLLYLVLPIAGALSGSDPLSFGQHLRFVLGAQKAALGGLPVYVLLLLSFTSVLPLLVIGVRFAGGTGDTSAAGAAMTVFFVRAIYLVLGIACVSVFFDTPWSPRTLGFGYALLPAYYLAAIAAGYFLGYFLLVSTVPRPKGPGQPSLLERCGWPVKITALAALLVAAGFLLARNFPVLRMTDGDALGRLADQMVDSLPPAGVVVIGDRPLDLMLLDARLHQRHGRHPHMLVHSLSLETPLYHEQLQRRYPRWPVVQKRSETETSIESQVVVHTLRNLIATNAVCYLNPSFGYFFESLRPVPRGVLYAMQTLPDSPLVPPPLPLQTVAGDPALWQSVEAAAAALPPWTNSLPAEIRYVVRWYGRLFNDRGVALQRVGDLPGAAKAFQIALRLVPANFQARVNLAFNSELAQGAYKNRDLSQPPAAMPETEDWGDLLFTDGPFDEPIWTMKVGEVFAQNMWFRQALSLFSRVGNLYPSHAGLRLWKENLTILTRFRLGDTEGAEKTAIDLLAKYPTDEGVLEVLIQIYALTGRTSNALAYVDRQLTINPSNQRALVNKGAYHIQLGEHAKAIAPLDKLLALQPNSAPGLLNRAIAHLQLGHLDLAQKDYEALREVMPEMPAVYYGLGEIAHRRKEMVAALTHYDLYLKYATKGSKEYETIARRAAELRQSRPR
ncbi:MAG TPA: tetratricopeptide repeat protein [Verrucomicrobiota bacterium]|nr:tetratricopeptide repeat protein [Verrucomicrobiota bacterium]HNU51286.1 tetratricopeptide repeat protein [Verrucomicrobiota bacterium]